MAKFERRSNFKVKVTSKILEPMYIKYESPTSSGKEDMAKVKVFFKSRSNFKVKVIRSKILVPIERSYQKECILVRKL